MWLKGNWEVERWLPLHNSERQKEGKASAEELGVGELQGLEHKRRDQQDLFLPGHFSYSADLPHLCPSCTGSTYPEPPSLSSHASI